MRLSELTWWIAQPKRSEQCARTDRPNWAPKLAAFSICYIPTFQRLRCSSGQLRNEVNRCHMSSRENYRALNTQTALRRVFKGVRHSSQIFTEGLHRKTSHNERVQTIASWISRISSEISRKVNNDSSWIFHEYWVVRQFWLARAVKNMQVYVSWKLNVYLSHS